MDLGGYGEVSKYLIKTSGNDFFLNQSKQQRTLGPFLSTTTTRIPVR